jgi:hypothetical protein
MVAGRFGVLPEQSGVNFDASCSLALRGVALSVCDYLAGLPGAQTDPHVESAVIAVLRRMLLEGRTGHSRSLNP